MSVIVDIDGQKVEWDSQPTKEDIEEFRRLSRGQQSSSRVGIKGLSDTAQYMYQQAFEGLKDLAKIGLVTGPTPQETADLKAQGLTDEEIKQMYSGGMGVIEKTQAPWVSQTVFPRKEDYLTRYAGAGSRAVTGSLGIGGIPGMFGMGALSEFGGDIAQAAGGPRLVGEIGLPLLQPVATAPFVAKKALESTVQATPEISSKIAQFQLGGSLEQLQQEVPDLSLRLAIAERLAAQNKNFKPNLAQITESSVAESLIKRQVAKEGGAEFKGKIDQAQRQTQKAAKNILQKNFPLLSDGIIDTTKATIRKNLEPVLEQQIKLNDSITNLGLFWRSKKGSQQQIGFKLRDILDKELKAATDTKNSLYAKAEEIATEKNLQVSPDQVKKIYDTIQENIDQPLNFIRALPAKERAVLEKVAPDGDAFPSISVSNVDGAIKNLNSRIFTLEGAATPESLTEALRLKNIRGSLSDAIASVDDKDYKNALSLANQYYKGDFKPRFREGMGLALLRSNQLGQKIANSEVVKNFLAKPENLDDFAKIYGGREDAYNLLKDGVYTSLIREGGDSLTSSNIQSFLKKYDEGLSKFPALKNELKNKQSFLTGLETQALEIEKQKNNALAGVLGEQYSNLVKLGDDGIVSLKVEEFQDSLNRMIASATTGQAVGAREFNRIKGMALKDPDATESLRNYVVNFAANQPNPTEFLRANDNLVGSLFKADRKDYKDAMDILRGIEMSRITPARGVPVTSAVPEIGEKQLGIPVSSIFSKISNPILSGTTATAQIFSKFLGKQIEQNKDVVYKAILSNPSGFKDALEKTQKITSSTELAKDLIKAIDLSPISTFFAKKGLKTGFVALQPSGDVVIDIDGNNVALPVEDATKENIEFLREQLKQ